MALILTAEDVVRRIAAECAFVDERGGVGIRIRPAAVIVRQYGEQFRAPRRQRRPRSEEKRRLCSDYFCAVRIGGGEPTFAEAMMKGDVALIPVARANTIDRLKSTHCRPSRRISAAPSAPD